MMNGHSLRSAALDYVLLKRKRLNIFATNNSIQFFYTL